MTGLLLTDRTVSDPIGMVIQAWQDPVYRPLLILVAVLAVILVGGSYFVFAAERRFKTVSIPKEEATHDATASRSYSGVATISVPDDDEVENPLAAKRSERLLAEQLKLLQFENERLRRRIGEAGGKVPDA